MAYRPNKSAMYKTLERIWQGQVEILGLEMLPMSNGGMLVTFRTVYSENHEEIKAAYFDRNGNRQWMQVCEA